MSEFKFGLGSKVRVSLSGEEGIAIGAAKHLRAQNQYRVEYKAADGRFVTEWFDEDSLEAIS